MRFYKMSNDGYINAVGKGRGGIEIAEAEYNGILSLVQNAPEAPEGFAYRLREDLTWEIYEVPVKPESDEITDEEAIDIITGVTD